MGDYLAEDGHFVKSRGEMLIDNWLYHHNYRHAYERKIPNIKQDVYPDFYIPEGDCYIEYWGLEGNDNYESVIEWKKKIYKKQSIKVVEIRNKDIKRISDVLPDKLGNYL